jgi:HTH-type transcriptional regulator, sugar sensing transcriptional regulator
VNLANVLQASGLGEKEAKVYLALLELGEATPATIARLSRIKRSTTYLLLGDLVNRGVATHVKKKKISYFRVLNPYLLWELQNEKLERLRDALPFLSELRKTAESTPQMSIYEGIDGLVQMMEETLTCPDTELCYWADMSLITTKAFKDYWRKYIQKRIARNIRVKGIVSYDPIAVEFKKNSKAELREVYLIPKKEFPFKNEINIYGNKLAIISHDDLMGVVIENKNIAETQRSIFNFAFQYAKIIEDTLLTSEDRKVLSL